MVIAEVGGERSFGGEGGGVLGAGEEGAAVRAAVGGWVECGGDGGDGGDGRNCATR